MNTIETKVFNRAVELLEAIGFKYAIQDREGIVHGELTPAQTAQRKKKAPAVYGYGVLKKHLDAHGLSSIQVNTHKVIPVGSFDTEVVRRSICSYGSKHWGNKTYKTSITADKKGVEVTRFDTTIADIMNDKADPLADILKGWN